MPALVAAPDPVLMIRPHFCLIMYGSAAWIMHATWTRFRVMFSCIVLTRSPGSLARLPPALLTQYVDSSQEFGGAVDHRPRPFHLHQIDRLRETSPPPRPDLPPA